MGMRSMVSGMVLTGFVLLLLASGCAKKAPATPEMSESGMDNPGTESGVSAEELARRERERRRAIEERERQMQMQSMRRGGPADQATREATLRQEFLNRDVHFAFDSATLSDEARTLLEGKATWLQTHPGLKVVIEGHCDERGTTAYNLALGARRANAAKRYLVALGVDAWRLSTISYGEERPLDPRHNESAWAQNRRAHFAIVGQEGAAGS
jgi:peptidoglycan-associated lipoprotein